MAQAVVDPEGGVEEPGQSNAGEAEGEGEAKGGGEGAEEVGRGAFEEIFSIAEAPGN